MTIPALTEQAAMFIAGLPREFGAISNAISVHAFVQRDAPLTVEAANAAIAVAVDLGFAIQNDRGDVRLADELVAERDHLLNSAITELAEYQLAMSLMQRHSRGRGT